MSTVATTDAAVEPGAKAEHGDEGAARRPQREADERAAGGREAAPLGTSRTVRPHRPHASGLALPVVPDERQERRRLRHARRARSSAWLVGAAREAEGLPRDAPIGDPAGWVRPRRPARCGWTFDDSSAVGVHGAPGQPAHLSGVEHCGSIWSCPSCSAVIRAERAREIDAAVHAWQKRGGAVVFVTLTMRHTRDHALAVTLDAALRAWRSVVTGSPWKRAREAFGIAGYVRAVEVTHGAHGWHPHIHALLFVENSWESAEAARFEGWLFERWASRVTRFGGGLPTRLRGVDVRQAGPDGRVVAQYLAKIQEHHEAPVRSRVGIGQEIARSDFKNGRGASLMPFELLDAPASDERARALWLEYVSATARRRAITWSRGLRDALLAEVERTDQEIVDDTETVAPEVFSVPASRWRHVRRDPALVCAILEAVEAGDARFAQALALGRLVLVDGWGVDRATGEAFAPVLDRGPIVAA